MPNPLRDPQFRADIVNGLRSAGRGAQYGLLADSLGMPVDLATQAMGLFGYRPPASGAVGGSQWIANKLRMPAEDNLQFNAGRFLGPLAAAKAPDALGGLFGLGANALSDLAMHGGRAGQIGAIGDVGMLRASRGQKSAPPLSLSDFDEPGLLDVAAPKWNKRGSMTVAINPSKQQLLKLLQESGQNEARVLITDKGMVAWPASDALHQDIGAFLGLKKGQAQEGMVLIEQLLD